MSSNRNYCRKAVYELGRTERYHLRRRRDHMRRDNDNEAHNEANRNNSESDGEVEPNNPLPNPDHNEPNLIQVEGPVELDHQNRNMLQQGQPRNNANNQEVVGPVELDYQNNDIPQDNQHRNDEYNIEAEGAVYNDHLGENAEPDNDQESENSDEEDNEGFDDARGDRPLYAGAGVTVGESMVLLLSLMLRHNLSSSCVGDILTIMKMICPNDAFQTVTLYKFMKYFSLGRNDKFKKHYYCSGCQGSLPSENADCRFCVDNQKVSYFIEANFLQQLQEMFKRENFYESLQHRRNQNHEEPNAIEDIYDGSVYQSERVRGFLSNPNNISLMWYTDGVQVFKSSKISMWPIYLSINELPYQQRVRRENILLVGLWYGKKKPNANVYLSKLRPQFESLYRGRNFVLYNRNVIAVAGILLAGTCDVPAKTHFLCLSLYSGAFGCNNCKLRGHTFVHPSGGHSQIFPYQRNIQERTSDETVEQGRRVIQQGIEGGIMGVRGVSYLSLLMPDFIGGTGIDIMHKVYGGVVKKMLHLWFDSSYSGEPFSLRLVTANIDQRLTSLKPPKHVHRMPRTVTELCHWKSSELKMFFYFFSLPVMSGIMQPLYFNHFSLLIFAISILNSNSIAPNDLDKAKKLLHKYVREFSDLYGERQCTINVHGLLHLPACVTKLGPLWVYSCFPFEDLNGKLLDHVHGTSHLDSQIVNRYSQVIKLQRKLENLRDGPTRDLLLNWKKKQVRINERLFQNCYSVGPYQRCDDIPPMYAAALQNLNVQPNMLRTYLRLLKDGKLFVSERYNRALKTVSAFALYNRNGFKQLGCISVFLKIMRCNCVNHCHCQGEHYAILKECLTMNAFEATDDNNRSYPMWHLKHCQVGNVISAVPVSDLKSVCVFMSVEGTQPYIGFPINDHEKE